MKWALIVAAGVIVGLLVASQFIIQGVAESEIESRLTEGGGTAEAEVSGFPAVRLLFSDGKRVGVEASDLNLELISEDEVFSALDGFEEVDISVENSQVGPMAISSFSLTRDGDGPYHLVSDSTTTGSELVQFGAEAMGLPGADILGAITGAIDDVAGEVPVALDMQLESDDGRIEVVSGGGTVAGYPTGPLAEIVVGAIVAQL